MLIVLLAGYCVVGCVWCLLHSQNMPGIRKQPPHLQTPLSVSNYYHYGAETEPCLPCWLRTKRPLKHFLVGRPGGDNEITCLQDTQAFVEMCYINQSLRKKKQQLWSGGHILNAAEQICWRLSGAQYRRGIQSQLAPASRYRKMPLFCFVLTYSYDVRVVNGCGIIFAIVETIT